MQQKAAVNGGLVGSKSERRSLRPFYCLKSEKRLHNYDAAPWQPSQPPLKLMGPMWKPMHELSSSSSYSRSVDATTVPTCGSSCVPSGGGRRHKGRTEDNRISPYRSSWLRGRFRRTFNNKCDLTSSSWKFSTAFGNVGFFLAALLATTTQSYR